ELRDIMQNIRAEHVSEDRAENHKVKLTVAEREEIFRRHNCSLGIVVLAPEIDPLTPESRIAGSDSFRTPRDLLFDRIDSLIGSRRQELQERQCFSPYATPDVQNPVARLQAAGRKPIECPGAIL